jgi:hypothetical protein
MMPLYIVEVKEKMQIYGIFLLAEAKALACGPCRFSQKPAQEKRQGADEFWVVKVAGC